jgi:hypothetical protein
MQQSHSWSTISKSKPINIPKCIITIKLCSMSFTETQVNTLHSLLSKTVTHMELELKHIFPMKRVPYICKEMSKR